MTICFFGIYNRNYNRNSVLIKGFKKNGVNILECTSNKKGVAKFFELIKKHCKVKGGYDYLFVAFPGQSVMPLAKIISKKKIIFDAFTSIYDSAVDDRKTAKKKSIRAAYYWLQDFLACRLSDIIITDSIENKEYFSKTFKVKKDRIIVAYVGCDEEVMCFNPELRDNNKIIIHFHGSYIPLQGVNYIMEATKGIKDSNIHFNIVGTKIKEKWGGVIEQDNVTFYDNLEYYDLRDKINESDICLGVFGDTEKTERVIPNKVFEGMACAKAIITANTRGIREVLSDKQNVLLCKKADSKDLVEKIKILANNDELRNRIASNAYKLYLEKYSSAHISKKLINILNEKHR